MHYRSTYVIIIPDQREEVMQMSESKKPASKDTGEVLKELLKILSENPEVAERITITIKPAKLTQQKPGK